MSEEKDNGYTLIEIMIAVVIIGLLAAIAIPAFTKSRIRAQNARLASDLRIFAGQMHIYTVENGDYPEDSSSGAIPTGLEEYIKTGHWYQGPSIGGVFDVEKNGAGFSSAVGVHRHDASDEQLMQFEQNYDDGDFATGAYRKIGGDRYYRMVAD